MKNQQNPNATSQGGVVKRAARWVARMFGYNAENKFARVVWYVFASCSALVAVYVTVALSILFFDEVDDMVSEYKYHRSSDSHYGLMDRNGNVITPPLYDRITAVSASLYLCEGDEGSVLLDDKGKERGEKL